MTDVEERRFCVCGRRKTYTSVPLGLHGWNLDNQSGQKGLLATKPYFWLPTEEFQDPSICDNHSVYLLLKCESELV